MSIHGSKHFIIASYYFPPLGLAGTARSLAMANYFAERGYLVSVLTVKKIDYPIYDRSMLARLHPNVTVHRAGSVDPARLKKILPLLPSLRSLRGRLNPKLTAAAFPDSKAGFVRPAARLLRKLIKDDMPNILITTSPPVSVHKLGLSIAKDYRSKWVADFRDIWGSLPFNRQPSEYVAKAKTYLRDIVSHADLVTSTSPKTIDYFRNEVDSEAEYYFLPNGYDESDFSLPAGERNGCIGLFGTLNYLVGIERLFEWICGLRQSHPGLGIRIRHTGYLDLGGVDGLLAQYSLRESFESVGYLPHYESIQDIRRNAVNVVMLSERYDTSYIIPSKLFELLRAEPPLVVILPKGNAARTLLEEHRFADVHVVEDENGFGGALAGILQTDLRDQRPGRREGIERFERGRELGAFLHLLEQL